MNLFKSILPRSVIDYITEFYGVDQDQKDRMNIVLKHIIRDDVDDDDERYHYDYDDYTSYSDFSFTSYQIDSELDDDFDGNDTSDYYINDVKEAGEYLFYRNKNKTLQDRINEEIMKQNTKRRDNLNGKSNNNGKGNNNYNNKDKIKGNGNGKKNNKKSKGKGKGKEKGEKKSICTEIKK